MKIKAAVLYAMDAKPPFAESRPLSIEEIDLAPPGPGEILVKIGAAGLCHSDLSVINGHRPRPMPMALGHEAAGVDIDLYRQGKLAVNRLMSGRLELEDINHGFDLLNEGKAVRQVVVFH